MHIRHRSAVTFAAVATFVCLAAGPVSAAVSTPAVIWGNPTASLQWKTVMSETISPTLDWPAGAVSATLSVRYGKDRASLVVTDTTATSIPLELHFPTDELGEGMVELTLDYKDAQSAVLDTQTARLGLVRGIGTNTARCVLDTSSKLWTQAKEAVMLPVPENTVSLTIDGEAVDPLDSPGWHWWQIAAAKNYELVLTDMTAVETTVVVDGRPRAGLVLYLR